ncbi:MAG: peptide-methionine (S)-S-oxide reductase MsrA [Spirochaeta sp.]
MKINHILILQRLLLILLLLLPAPLFSNGAAEPQSSRSASESGYTPPPHDDRYERATLAGGCFWCMEPPYDKTDGVISTISGFSGGEAVDPSYDQVASGTTNHIETVQITYDPEIISYQEILDIFWVNIDPLDAEGQFCDRGPHYRSAIFYHSDQQEEIARRSRRELAESGIISGEIVTELIEFEAFYPAEEYHQDYYRKNPIRNTFYRSRCGRDDRLQELWGDRTSL